MIFRDLMFDIFGIRDVPDTVPLRILGLSPPVPSREVIVSAFRKRAIEVHPDLQLAYDNPAIQDAAEAVESRPEIRELVWARDVLLDLAPDPNRVTVTGGVQMHPPAPVTPKAKVCRKCHRELGDRECYPVGGRRAWWCGRCVDADNAAQARERRRRRRADRPCDQCGVVFTPPRSDGRYCSPRCRQAAFRSRVTGSSGDGSATDAIRYEDAIVLKQWVDPR
jgi:hypothetical protein